MSFSINSPYYQHDNGLSLFYKEINYFRNQRNRYSNKKLMYLYNLGLQGCGIAIPYFTYEHKKVISCYDVHKYPRLVKREAKVLNKKYKIPSGKFMTHNDKLVHKIKDKTDPDDIKKCPICYDNVYNYRIGISVCGCSSSQNICSRCWSKHLSDSWYLTERGIEHTENTKCPCCRQNVILKTEQIEEHTDSTKWSYWKFDGIRLYEKSVYSEPPEIRKYFGIVNLTDLSMEDICVRRGLNFISAPFGECSDGSGSGGSGAGGQW